jgi:uncharacterized protein
MKRKFLEAEWKHLIMANYAVDPALLLPYLPAGTELDLWDGKCYVSLVGFMFQHTKVLGIKIPFHVNFEEVNLRFYVRHNDNGVWKRGVVFISEIVPKPAIAFVANTFFNEHYHTCRMKHRIEQSADWLYVGYQWKYKGEWNSISVVADPEPVAMQPGSEEEFITEHYWGYSKTTGTKTTEYAVEHPRWKVHRVETYEVQCNFGELYGAAFASLAKTQPDSVLLAEGAEVVVRNKRILMC